MNDRIRLLLNLGHGVISRRQNPDARHALDWALRRGHLVAVLPGIYATPADAGTLLTRARAARLRDPDCVIVGPSAAALMGWSEIPEPGDLHLASTRLRARPGFRVERRTIPRRLARIIDGLLVSGRALTALDLIPTHGPDPLDNALRRGVPLAELQLALNLVPHRRGHLQRRRLLAESAGRPFSKAERCAHGLLRSSGITGWVGNRAFFDADGALVAAGDLVFDEARLIIEIDGRQHLRPEAVLKDRARDLWLGTRGWSVQRVDAALVLNRPRAFVHLVGVLLAAHGLRQMAEGPPHPSRNTKSAR